MDYSFSDEYDYTPIHGGNRESDKPAVFHLRYLTLPEREECAKVEYISVDGVMQRRTTFDYSKILKYSIIGIDNLSVHKVKLTTASAFLAIRGFAPMASEVANYCAEVNSKPNLKN